jgi:hypothetical protein
LRRDSGYSGFAFGSFLEAFSGYFAEFSGDFGNSFGFGNNADKLKSLTPATPSFTGFVTVF